MLSKLVFIQHLAPQNTLLDTFTTNKLFELRFYVKLKLQNKNKNNELALHWTFFNCKLIFNVLYLSSIFQIWYLSIKHNPLFVWYNIDNIGKVGSSITTNLKNLIYFQHFYF